MSRIQLDEGDRATPAHVQGAEEEIFYILGGQGVSWQDGETFDVRAGDTLVHLPCREAHTLIGGPGGIDALAFGQRIRTEACHLPRAGVFWLGPAWTDDAVAAGHPWDREVAAGDIPMPERSPRPPRIVAAEDVPAQEYPGARALDLGRAAGSVATGIKLAELGEGAEGAPPHCHGAEEEIFVVLDGQRRAHARRRGARGAARDGRGPAARHARAARLPRRRGRADVPGLRHARAERHRLLPALGQGVAQGRRHRLQARAGRVLGAGRLSSRMDPLAERGFADVAADYELGRPGYPPAAIDLAVAGLGLGRDSTVLDLAAGTGKLTRAIAPRVGRVIAVEPSEGMRAALRVATPDVEVLDGLADDIPLDDASVDGVVVGDAFHWFATRAALDEIARVLVPRGGLALLFNGGDWSRDGHAWWPDVHEVLLARQAPGRTDANTPETRRWRGAFRGAPFGPMAEAIIPAEVERTLPELVALIGSWSVIGALEPDERRSRAARARAGARAAHRRRHGRHQAPHRGLLGAPERLIPRARTRRVASRI